MTEDSSIPDLEDCSHLLQKFANVTPPETAGEIDIIKSDSQPASSFVDVSKVKEVAKIESTDLQEAESMKRKKQYCGMKKGFLLAPTNKTMSTEITKPSPKGSEIPYIKKSETQNSSFRIQEVQQQLIDKKSEWLTDDLLSTVQNSDDNFLEMLSNPEFAGVLQEFQQNPQQAMIKYQNNNKIVGFFNKFAKLMGDHFTKLGAKQA